MKHKSIGIALLTLAFSTVIVAVSMIFSNGVGNMDMSMVKGMAVLVSQALRRVCLLYTSIYHTGELLSQ